MKSNAYSEGTLQATVSVAQMKAKKFAAGMPYHGLAIGLLNKAFEIYYNAKRSIDAVSDAKHKKKMLDDLADCATEGWGIFGVDDLDEAFAHLAETGGDWTDDSSASYMRSRFKPQGSGAVMEAPKAAVTFLTALDDRYKKIDGLWLDYQSATAQFSEGLDTSNWKQIEVGLKSISENGGYLEKLMWFAPKSVSGPGEKAATFASVLGEIDEGVRNFQKLKQAGLNDTAAGSLVALKKVASYVPAVGYFYSEMFGAMPDAILNMSEFFKERNAKIIRYARMQ